MSPFFANLGYDPLWQFNSIQPSQATPTQDRPATDVARTMIEITDHLKTEMHRAQLRQQEQADRRRAPASNFKVGDKVWFNSKNIVTRRPSRKLDHRRMRPFEIVKIVFPWAYELRFPDELRVHSVQHVSLLELADEDPLSGQMAAPPPPIEEDEGLEFQVEEIADSRLYYRKLRYLVK
jgi:hypothetical protein